MNQFVNSPQTYDYETEFFIKNKNKHPKKNNHLETDESWDSIN